MYQRSQNSDAAINDVLNDIARVLGYGTRDNLPMLIDRKQAAKVLDTTPGTLAVWDCVKRVNLEMTKVGNNARYRPIAIARHIVSNTQHADAA